MSQYSDIRYFMSLDYDTCIDMLKEAKKRVHEERMYKLWLVELQSNEETDKNFQNYMKKLKLDKLDINVEKKKKSIEELRELASKIEQDDKDNKLEIKRESLR